eukprot:jgi/Bigna1/133863/aug1.23_g8571
MTAPKRKYTFSITDFGAVGGNKTVNSQAFADAIAKAQTVAKDGGCYLLIPAGCWGDSSSGGRRVQGSVAFVAHLCQAMAQD